MISILELFFYIKIIYFKIEIKFLIVTISMLLFLFILFFIKLIQPYISVMKYSNRVPHIVSNRNVLSLLLVIFNTRLCSVLQDVVV